MERKTDTRAVFERLAQECIIPDAGLETTGDNFRLWCKPAVYAFLLNGKVLYVGLSNSGISRPSSRAHHKRDVREICDQVMVWPCKSLRDARRLEAALIHFLKPKHNETLHLAYLNRVLGRANTNERI